MEAKADIAVIGLAVMGRNLILNMSDHGFTVVAYNRTVSKVDEFLNGDAQGKENILGAHSVEEMIALLKKPRKIMLMVKAGEVVDTFIETVLPYLSSGDCIIDGGNSHFTDTIRRTVYLSGKNILFVGTGISGGEEGARHGPSVMPGGNPKAWPLVKDIFQTISAKVNGNEPCCDWVGPDGAGHYVKMVHNGIEYGDMQLICEAYHLMKTGLCMTADEMHQVFAEWNRGELESYLIEITGDILAYKDDDGAPLVEKIVDVAGQKGTGKWTGISSFDLGIPITLISDAVYSRYLSALKDERINASSVLNGPEVKFNGDRESFVEDIRKALYASKIISYAQGFMLLRSASQSHNWELNCGDIALLWRGGCIIRSSFLNKIKEAYTRNPDLENLLFDDYFKAIIEEYQNSWRRVVAHAVEMGIPVSGFATTLFFYDGYRSDQLPANLLQAQRDYFGAHTYERVDRPRGEFFHTNWTGRGGEISSTTYNA